MFVTVFLRDSDGERHDVHASLHCFVDAAHAWLVIPGDQKLELWLKLEIVLAHEVRCDAVSTCQGFDARFVPASACSSFFCSDETSTAQACKLSAMSL